MLVQQIAKDFGGHDEDLRVGLVFDVTGHDSYGCLGELAFEVTELLIGQGFDGGGDEGTLS